MNSRPGRFAAYWERQLDRLDEQERRRERRLPAWRTRRRRRQLVVLVLLGDLVLIASAASFKLAPPWFALGTWFGGFAIGAIGFVLLRILTGRMSGGFSRLLDEREREWRHRITFVAYLTLTFLMVVAMFYGLLISQQHDSGVRGAMMLAALLVTGSTVPTIVLGWLLPDDDPEDFLEEGNGDE
ncbi:hypothetical protein ACFWY9_41785 [Amycolatopsis sp. NPDC059027]|uniref:hypothetical protein n=1 Tax=unclassified Amycolatopsis TaxID=2618356 RepID=UPI0036701F5B